MAVWLRVRTVKGRLALLSMGLVVASLLAAGWLVLDAQVRARATFERQLQDTARALSLVVDRQLAKAAAFNAALATSTSLESADLAAFDARARRALGGQEAWVVLSDRSGQQLVNTLKPFGSPLPRRDQGVDRLWRAFTEGRTVVGDLMSGAVAGRPVLAVSTPVVVHGAVVYGLSYVFEPDAVLRLLVEQRLPEGWIATVTDASHHVVARTVGGDDMVGRPATADFVTRIARAREGVFESTSLDGLPTLLAYSRIPSGWTVTVVVPQADVRAGVDRSLRLAGLVALGIIAAGATAALSVARSISWPLTRLAGLAAALGEGRRLAFAPTGMAEADAAGQALVDASARLEERERALAASEERQRLAFEAAGIGIWDVDVVAGTRSWSPEYRMILGLPEDHPADPDAFAAMIVPEDRPRVMASYADLYRPGARSRYLEEFRIRRAADGEERWVRTEGRVRRDGAGRALRGTGIIVDVTAQHRDRAAIAASMERLRVAVASVPFPLMLEAAGGAIVEASRAWWDRSVRDPATTPTTRAWARETLGDAAADDPARAPFGYRVPDGEARLSVAGGERIWEFRAVPLDALPDGRALRLVAAVDVTERELAAKRQGLLVGELNHRVKNTLATVQAIASRTALTTREPDAFIEKFSARLQALARTHVILTDHNWGRVDLRQLLDAELSPFSASGAVTVIGPDIDVAAETAVSLSLLLHELATNAAKHGCLVKAGGRLRVAWTVRRDAAGRGGFDLTWAETCPEPIEPTGRQGFGSRLIEHTLRSLGGGALEFGDYGLTLRLEVRV